MTVQTTAERPSDIASANSMRPRAALRAGPVTHLGLALAAITRREVGKFIRQKGRWASALVRPLLWLIVFAAGFRSLLGVSIVPPYETYVTYQEYILPGLLGIVLLFYGMQSSLSMVYDREMGIMRLLLTAPLPRWILLLFKLLSATFLAVVQAYIFLLIVFGVSFVMPYLGVRIPATGWIYILPPLIGGGLMLSALGLLLSVYIRQLENFAGTMNFVIFPMFFISPALYPLWKLREQGAEYIYWIAQINPFTHTIELIRFAAYGKFNFLSFGIVLAFALVFFIIAAIGYDPQRGMLRRKGKPGGGSPSG
jgi:ABC-2 type transport system permease protein